MNEPLKDFSQMLLKQRLKLTLNYVTPSLNRTIRQHWTEQLQEKRKGWTALSSALKATASDPSTPITLREVAKTCSMALDMHISLGEMSHGESSFKRSKKEFRALAKNAQKLR
jgi:hypothetical protein